MKHFALIGAAGYIAPRHMKAIADTGNELLAAFDPYDGVGQIDQYFPESDFFVEFERFDRHLEKMRRAGVKLDYVSICSPNYLHDAHIRFALRNHADAICEKPLVLNPWNIEALDELSKEMNQRVYNILQLRLHPEVIALKKRVEEGDANTIYDIDLSYITSRGRWYDFSWKGDIKKSGGIATNIGIHFFDLLVWVFGDVQRNVIHVNESRTAAGYLELKHARVRWFLSIDSAALPQAVVEQNQRTYRLITVNGEELDLSQGFTDLHTLSYQKILKGEGFDITEVYHGVQLAHGMRNAKAVGLKGDYHPFCEK